MRQADNFFFVLMITAWARERPGDSSGQRERGRCCRLFGDIKPRLFWEREAECKEPKKWQDQVFYRLFQPDKVKSERLKDTLLSYYSQSKRSMNAKYQKQSGRHCHFLSSCRSLKSVTSAMVIMRVQMSRVLSHLGVYLIGTSRRAPIKCLICKLENNTAGFLFPPDFKHNQFWLKPRTNRLIIFRGSVQISWHIRSQHWMDYNLTRPGGGSSCHPGQPSGAGQGLCIGGGGCIMRGVYYMSRV